jgi:membrane complex biogenesis BtpA family protein
MVENFGDAPFFAEDVPDITVAAMTRLVAELKGSTDLPIGVNVLRNDSLAAAAVAIATQADMIRVNVLAGTMYTDQGPIIGRAAELARFLAPFRERPLVLADVFVKHASAPPGLTVEDAARDTAERGGADALVVSGSGTGAAIDTTEAVRVRQAATGVPIVVGSGAREGDLSELARVADAIIVGTSIKPEGSAGPVDAGLAARFVSAAREAGVGT